MGGGIMQLTAGGIQDNYISKLTWEKFLMIKFKCGWLSGQIF